MTKKSGTGGILAPLSKLRGYRPAPEFPVYALGHPLALMAELNARGREAIPGLIVPLLAWLQEALRPNGDTPWRLVIEPRRISRRMRERQRAIDDLIILHEVQQRTAALRAKGQRRSPMKQAIAEVAKERGIGTKMIEAALTRARKILKN